MSAKKNSSARPQPEPEKEPWHKRAAASLGRVAGWVNENWVSLALIAEAGYDSVTHLAKLAREHGQAGVSVYTIAGIFDMMAFFFNREIQKDKRDGVTDGRRWWPVIFLIASLSVTIIGNWATASKGKWGVFFAIIAPIYLILVILFRERRKTILNEKAKTASTEASTGTGTASTGPSTRTSIAASTGQAAAGTAAPVSPPLPRTPVTPRPEPQAHAISGPLPANVVSTPDGLIPPGFRFETLRSPHDLEAELNLIRRAAAAYRELNPGRKFTADACRRTCGKSKAWACEMLPQAFPKNSDEDRMEKAQ